MLLLLVLQQLIDPFRSVCHQAVPLVVACHSQNAVEYLSLHFDRKDAVQVLFGLRTLPQQGWHIFSLGGELLDVVFVPGYLILQVLKSLLLGIKDIVLSLSRFFD